MAHSSNFFGLRRGSTKSLTFQVLRGQQITKDRVTSVANPQTQSQMEQRLKIPMVASARSTLKTLINHSFEGVAYGEESLKEFSRSNLLAGALTVSSYVPKGAMDCGEANFIVSKGSLPINTLSVESPFDTAVLTSGKTITAIPDSFKGAEANSAITAAQIADLLPILAGDNNDIDQLTFLAAYPGTEYNWDSDNGGKTAHFHRWRVSRLIFDVDRFSENIGWEVLSVTDNQIILDNDYFLIYLDLNKQPQFTLIGDPTPLMCMMTVISSKKTDSVWRRSSQRMTIGQNDGISYSDVISSYLKDTEIRSGRYLNSGSDGVNISGGEITSD